MDKYDRRKYDGDEPHNYNPSSRQSFNNYHNKRNSPHDYRSGGGGGGGGAGSLREHQRAYDSPQTYPEPPSGGGGLGAASDGIGGFRGDREGSGGYRMGQNMDDRGGFRGGDDGGRFMSMTGGDGGGYPMMGRNRGGSSGGFHGGDGGGYRTMGHVGGNGGEFRPLGGSGGFRPMGSDFSPGAAGDGSEFRPMGGGGVGYGPMDGGGFGRDDGRGYGTTESYEVKREPLIGQKRGYPFSGGERPPDRGASFAKLFVGSVPRTATEDDIRPLFDKHGRVLEIALIRDKRTGQQQGCCFVKYASSEEADGAIRALHNQYTLPGGVAPIQVRYADGERERLGATEYKLFVGSLNKLATEKEVEDIFLPYGRVEDVYLMRDEMKQSRGCGFVKYSQREMALAAINALNGKYTMRGCDLPLTVRFADPKRPRPGESRSGPSSGEPGFGPQFTSPGNRPPACGGPPHGYMSTSSWPSVSPQHLGPPSYAGDRGFANQGPTDGFPGSADTTRPAPTVSSAPGSKLGPPFDSKTSPVQRRPLQSPKQFQPPNVQSSLPSNMQPGQIPAPYTAMQTPPYVQAQASQRQSSVTRPQLSSTPGRAPWVDNQQQQPAAQQSPSQLAQMVSQQKQTLQATFQSSQQALNQLQQQVLQLQPSNQNVAVPHQGPQAARQQSAWAGVGSQPAATTTSATTTVSPAATSCDWTEHVSPDGYKYYYNSITGESKWEKPEELVSYEQQKQQQQQKTSNQHPQGQSYPAGPSINHAPQIQTQFQGQYQGQGHNHISPLQQAPQSSSQYQPHGNSANQGPKGIGYSQIPAGSDPVSDLARYQQGAQTSQEWMWKK